MRAFKFFLEELVVTHPSYVFEDDDTLLVCRLGEVVVILSGLEVIEAPSSSDAGEGDDEAGDGRVRRDVHEGEGDRDCKRIVFLGCNTFAGMTWI